MPSLIRCARRQSPLTQRWSAALTQAGDVNTFNPSLAVYDGTTYIAYRAYGEDGQKPFRAFMLRETEGGWERSDLTSQAEAHGVGVVADPKLVVLGDALYVTFNSGYSKTQNELYLMRLAPSPGPPQRCLLEPRQQVEKNWGFFVAGDGLAALYSVSPYVVLRLARGELGAGDLEFEPRPGANPDGSTPGLTLGPQPIVRGDELLVIAHERVRLRGRRGYLGRPVVIADPLHPTAPRVTVSPTRLIHSLRGLVVRGERHNPNLLFANYFSGAVVDGPSARLAYGINDTDFGFAELRTDRLWR